MTKYIIKSRKKNYTRFGCFMPEKETVYTKLTEAFKKTRKPEKELIEILKKDSNIDFRIREDKVSKNSTARKKSYRKKTEVSN